MAALGRYQLGVYSSEGRLETVYSLMASDQMRYSKTLSGIGSFLFTLPQGLRQSVLTQRDAMVRVFRVNPTSSQMEDDGVFLLNFFDNVPGDYRGYVCSGVSPESLLKTRIYVPQDDPLVANGFSTKAGSAVEVMREIVTEQCVSPAVNAARRIPGFRVNPTTIGGAGDRTYFRREAGTQTVLDVLNEIRKRVDFKVDYVGTDVVHGYPQFEFSCGSIGRDHSKHTNPNGPYVYLIPTAGNLKDPQFTLDRAEEKTVVYVLGKGANGNRLVYRKASSAIRDSPFNYREVAVEANEADTLDELETAADKALEDTKAKITFTFEPVVTATGAIYELDWDLGDIVTVGANGADYDMRVTGIDITLQGGQETLAIETELYSWA
jgi:hypothetical protein